jgi:selenocysteine lyase/cysteine desulfurase
VSDVPIYANQAGTSFPKAPGVEKAASRVLASPPSVGLQAYEAARAAACQWLGIEDEARLLLTPGCTSALAVAISDLPWQAGDVVITSALEHHALVRPIERLVSDRGVVHAIAPYTPADRVDLDFVADTLRAGRVRLVAVTGASNVSGEVLPVEHLAQLAHAHGALLLLDAAQTLGVLPIDVRKVGADLLAFTAHKAVMATHGIGGLWAAPHVVFESPAAVCEVRPGEGPARGACSSFPGYCDVGSVNLAAAAGLGAAIDWHRGGGAGGGAAAVALAAQLRQHLVARPGCRVLGAAEGPHTATLSVVLDALPVARAEEHFAAAGIVVRAAQHCAPLAMQTFGTTGGVLRISLGAGNTAAEVDAIVGVVDALGSVG